MSSITEQIIARLKELQSQMRYYGLYMGGALVLVELLQYLMFKNVTSNSIVTFCLIKLAILFTVSIYIVKQIKTEFFKRGINYMQSFSIIFRLFLYGSLLAGIFVFVLNNWIDPLNQANTNEAIIIYLKETVEPLQLPESQLEQINRMISEVEDTPAPTTAAIMWGKIWSYLSLGTFVAFILSFFMRDRARNYIVKTQEESEN